MPRRTSAPRIIAASLLTTALLLSGCNRKEAEGPAETRPAVEPAAPSSVGPEGSAAALRSAASEFETMAAKASSATWAEIDSLYAHARSTAAQATATLSRTAAADLDRSMQLLDRARREEDRAAFELASLDAKRNLILGRTTDAAHPTAPAELLVTAGERYAALARARTPDWSALSAAAAAADEAWRRTAPSLRPQSIPNTMQASLTAMADAAKARDQMAARSAGDLQLAASRAVLKELEAGKSGTTASPSPPPTGGRDQTY